MSGEDETMKKQNLLKEQIFDRGYDIEHFSQYLDQLKENGEFLFAIHPQQEEATSMSGPTRSWRVPLPTTKQARSSRTQPLWPKALATSFIQH
jgi:hypothetical protein